MTICSVVQETIGSSLNRVGISYSGAPVTICSEAELVVIGSFLEGVTTSCGGGRLYEWSPSEPYYDALDLSAVQGDLSVNVRLNRARGQGRDRVYSLHEIRTGPGNDVIIGGPSVEVIRPGKGDDVVRAGAGRDSILGSQAGNDRYFGGRGGEEMIHLQKGDRVDYGSARQGVTVDLRKHSASGAGQDVLRGIETIEATDFDDRIHGNRRANDLRGWEGHDLLYGHEGADRLITNRQSVLQGGSGDDDLTVNFSGGRIYGGPGADLIFGGRGASAIWGGPGGDDLLGGGGVDVIAGQRGNDSLDGGDREDTGDGGPGIDTCSNFEHATRCEESPEP